MKKLDMKNFPPLWFHIYILGFSIISNFALIWFHPYIREGFFYSWGIQLFWLELRYWSYFMAKERSVYLQLLFFFLSFFTNLLFLWKVALDKGSNFILGFFLAYFAFLGIFVLAGIFSQRHTPVKHEFKI